MLDCPSLNVYIRTYEPRQKQGSCGLLPILSGQSLKISKYHPKFNALIFFFFAKRVVSRLNDAVICKIKNTEAMHCTLNHSTQDK